MNAAAALQTLALLGVAGACLLIVTACICRVNLLERRTHRLGWSLMYVAMAAFAAGEGLGLLDGLPTWNELAGLLAVGANLALTRRSWKDRPPPITQRPSTQERLDAALQDMGGTKGGHYPGPDYRLVRAAQSMEQIARASQSDLRRMVRGAPPEATP